MKRIMPVMWCVTIVVAYLAGYGAGPSGRAAGQTPARGAQAAGTAQTAPLAGALPPGQFSRMSLAPDGGEPTMFSAADLRKAHTALQARASGGQVAANPRDLMTPFISRTHSYVLVHRSQPQNTGQAASAEQHEGVTDVYFVVGGSGTVTVGGELDNRRTARPGEFLGPIKGGKAFKLQTGDILNIPPNTPHGTVPDAGGMTYILMKVNVGLYPWSLINGTP
jgi:mannose-6-phosphate isomerase-like protein (cupin superfamily)